MIVAEPLDAPHDAPVMLVNGDVAAPLHARWMEATGAVFETEITVPPGAHDADELGLFSTLIRTKAADRASTIENLLEPVHVELSNGQTLVRRRLPTTARREQFEEDGLAGALFSPAEATGLPAAIWLPGAGGGPSPQVPALLAGHGLVTLSLPYYGLPGLPDDLVEIPLEYFERAIEQLRRRPEVDPRRIALVGRSKGGELALLLASLIPGIAGVVAYVPSSQTQGWSGNKPCWTWRGQVLPFASVDRSANRMSPNGRFSIRAGYQSTLRDPAEAERCAIRVENIAAPILLISGGDDQTWPSSLFCERILQRAVGHPVTHLAYPEAGHVISEPNQPRIPAADAFMDDGGSPLADAVASRDSWPRVVRFLREVGLAGPG